MKQADRDDLLIRLDERTRNTYNLMEKQETHLDKLNKSVEENTVSCSENKTSNKNLWRVMYGMLILLAASIGIGIVF